MGANQQHITFEWIAPDLAQENPLQYVDHPEEQIDALRYLIHEGPGWAGTAVITLTSSLICFCWGAALGLWGNLSNICSGYRIR